MQPGSSAAGEVSSDKGPSRKSHNTARPAPQSCIRVASEAFATPRPFVRPRLSTHQSARLVLCAHDRHHHYISLRLGEQLGTCSECYVFRLVGALPEIAITRPCRRFAHTPLILCNAWQWRCHASIRASRDQLLLLPQASFAQALLRLLRVLSRGRV